MPEAKKGMFTERVLEALKNSHNESTEPRKQFGGVISLSTDILSEMLPFEGTIIGAQYDPVSRSIKFFYLGDKEHFPPVVEGARAEDLETIVEVRENELQSINLIHGDKSYNHYLREESKSNGKDTKKEEECRECVAGFSEIPSMRLEWKPCFRSETCKHKKDRKAKKCHSGYERNFCKHHPQGECPRKKGDCTPCQFK